jgi:TfuA-like protein
VSRGHHTSLPSHACTSRAGVYQAFRDETLARDDEVAVGPGSEAMVNVRRTLAAAEQQGIISAVTAGVLLTAGTDLFYPERTWPGSAPGRRGEEFDRLIVTDEMVRWACGQAEWAAFGDLLDDLRLNGEYAQLVTRARAKLDDDGPPGGSCRGAGRPRVVLRAPARHGGAG